MKTFKFVGLAGLFLGCAAVVGAQNIVSPGELSGPSTVGIARPSFDASASAAAVLPGKQKFAQVEDHHQKRMRMLWVASIFAMTAGTAADAYSSWHKKESNGLLASSDGTFGAKGIAIKAGIGAGMLVPQIIFRKKRDWHSAFALSNFLEAGIFTGATIHNLNVKTAPAK